ncbi:MAG: HPF/RaiA family ribosome-associated protein [Candidatus Thiodiazotropha sp. (ex Monitilora ramsayi)]|nr:HPF/RaiA family ribosome-associated protein [Candidatus Thiodiazotropha sp. (ex Monitilora ramsayi)]
MQIDIQARNFYLTEAIRDHTKRRLHFTLSCCKDRIQRVVVKLSDINGPRGGADKRCQVHVTLAALPDVLVEDIEADLYVAIDRATDRTGRTVIRRISRQHTLLRHGNKNTG